MMFQRESHTQSYIYCSSIYCKHFPTFIFNEYEWIHVLLMSFPFSLVSSNVKSIFFIEWSNETKEIWFWEFSFFLNLDAKYFFYLFVMLKWFKMRVARQTKISWTVSFGQFRSRANNHNHIFFVVILFWLGDKLTCLLCSIYSYMPAAFVFVVVVHEHCSFSKTVHCICGWLVNEFEFCVLIYI